MGRKVVTLMLDFATGPLVGGNRDENGKPHFGPVVDDDPIVQDLAKEIWELYDSLYTMVPVSAENHAGFDFDNDRYNELLPTLLDLSKKLLARLNEINDGSFRVVDWLTGELQEDIEKGWPREFEEVD